MKDTNFNGKKNNTYYQTILNKNPLKKIKNFKVRLSSSNQKKDSLFFPCLISTAKAVASLKGRVGLGATTPLASKPLRGYCCLSSIITQLPTGPGLIKNQQRNYHISNIRAVNRIGPHNEDVISVIIGSLLGDAYANRRSGEGVRICYRQSIRHKEYLFWLYTFFYNRGYTSNLKPRQYTRTITSKEGKVYYGYEFNTFTFSSLSGIHKMFYNKGKKTIPLNIYEYLTPLALAVWIMDDGGWTNYGVRIATNSFKLKEVELLQDVLKSKYNLETTIQNIYIKDQYSIYIKKQSVNNLRNIVGPYIHSSMLYKLG
jgi:hypothetical protein